MRRSCHTKLELTGSDNFFLWLLGLFLLQDFKEIYYYRDLLLRESVCYKQTKFDTVYGLLMLHTLFTYTNTQLNFTGFYSDKFYGEIFVDSLCLSVKVKCQHAFNHKLWNYIYCGDIANNYSGNYKLGKWCFTFYRYLSLNTLQTH